MVREINRVRDSSWIAIGTITRGTEGRGWYSATRHCFIGLKNSIKRGREGPFSQPRRNRKTERSVKGRQRERERLGKREPLEKELDTPKDLNMEENGRHEELHP